MSAVIVAAGVFHMYRDELLQLNMQELYASIRDSVTTGYLEPNGISPADFAWPDGSLLDWDYFYEELLVTYAMSEIFLKHRNHMKESLLIQFFMTGWMRITV